MEPQSYYRQYSLVGIRRRYGTKPSKSDLPENFVDLMERMGFEIEDSPEWMENCLGISRGHGTDFIARVDFNEGIVIAKAEERLNRIRTLGLEELPLRSVCFSIPGTYQGGSMQSDNDVEKRIPKFRDYLKKHTFKIITSIGNPDVEKVYATRKCGELWGGCIEVFPHEPWGEELVRICKEYK